MDCQPGGTPFGMPPAVMPADAGVSRHVSDVLGLVHAPSYGRWLVNTRGQRGRMMIRERPLALAVAVVCLALVPIELFTAHPGFRLSIAVGLVAGACVILSRVFRAAVLPLWGLALAFLIVAIITSQDRVY
jgi:hypothetical protein